MNTPLNIVELIESNPITRLSSEYQNKFLMKIKENFTETQQQLFVSSFYCYLNYNPTTEFVIDLDNVWKWLDFSQKIRAKELLEKHFVIEKDYKISLMKLNEQKNEGRGGHNKETILMTVETFKLLCLKADTKKANEIHEYFVKLEKLLHQIVHEESNELKLQLEQTSNQLEQTSNQFEQSKKEFKVQLDNEKVLQKENALLNQFKQTGPIVYIIKVKSLEQGKYIVKIGESRVGIEGRYTEHKKNYQECVLLDCYAVLKSKDFENFIHDKIRIHKVKDLPGHEKENELFLIGQELSYKMVTKIIEDNIKRYNEYSQKDFLLLESQNEILQHKLLLQNNSHEQDPLYMQFLKSQNENLIKENETLKKQVDKFEKMYKETIDKLNASQAAKTTTGFNQLNQTVGPRLQKINPENLSLVKVYETVSEALTESNHKLKRPTIQGAVDENTIYQGFRWAYVERNQDPHIVSVPPTKETKVQNLGYIAKLNQEKTEILNVYLDRKTASRQNGLPCESSLDYPVKNDKSIQGFYYTVFDQCPELLQNSFIENKGRPLLYKDGVGQFDVNNQLVQEFSCKYDCIKKLQMSDKTLAKALNKEILYNQCYYRSLPGKFFV